MYRVDSAQGVVAQVKDCEQVARERASGWSLKIEERVDTRERREPRPRVRAVPVAGAVVRAREVVQVHRRPEPRRVVGEARRLDEAERVDHDARDVRLAVKRALVGEERGRRHQLRVGDGNERANGDERHLTPRLL